MPAHSVELCKPFLKLVDRNKCKGHEAEVEIVEKTASGAGTITITVGQPCLVFQPGREPTKWLAHTQCADGAFIVFEEDGSHLHIVELKSRLTAAEWDHARKQMEGMLVNAMALKGVINIPDYTKVICYVAFKKDDILPSKTASPITLKVGVGLPFAVAGTEGWLKGSITLLNKFVATVVKIQRDAEGNGAHSLTPA